MKVKYLDRNTKSFMYLSFLLVLFLLSILTFFVYMYHYSTINTYNVILLIIMILTILITLLFSCAIIAVFYTYRMGFVKGPFLWFVKLGLNMLLPFVTFISGLFKRDKDAVRGFYIHVNNVIVQSTKGKYKPQEIIVLLPHCLQHSTCGYKITSDIDNCKRCGKCSICEIARITKERGIKALVVTGGTVARNIITQYAPKIVLSVACERDLASGIVDTWNIPVIGVLNSRPDGPCKNTVVDIESFKKKLESILIK